MKNHVAISRVENTDISSLTWDPPFSPPTAPEMLSKDIVKRLGIQQPVSGLRRSGFHAFVYVCISVSLSVSMCILSPPPSVYVSSSASPVLFFLPSLGLISKRSRHFAELSLFLLHLPNQGYLCLRVERCCYSWWYDCIATQQHGVLEEERQWERAHSSSEPQHASLSQGLLCWFTEATPILTSEAQLLLAFQTWRNQKVGHI